jgi:hypothetical protein
MAETITTAFAYLALNLLVQPEFNLFVHICFFIPIIQVRLRQRPVRLQEQELLRVPGRVSLRLR